MLPTLGHCLGDDFKFDPEALEDRLEGCPVIAAVAVIWIDPSDGGELAFEVFDGEERRHHRFALVVIRLKAELCVGQLFVDAILRRAVPKKLSALCYPRPPGPMLS